LPESRHAWKVERLLVEAFELPIATAGRQTSATIKNFLAAQRGSWNNWSRSFPGCTRRAGPGDCEPSHILCQGGTLRPIDFEDACLIDQTRLPPWGSPDYILPSSRGRFSRRAETFEDDYALGVIAFQFGAGKFPPTAAHSRAALYRRTGCPDHLRKEIDRLLGSKNSPRRVK
jgi:hypothetical protein